MEDIQGDGRSLKAGEHNGTNLRVGGGGRRDGVLQIRSCSSFSFYDDSFRVREASFVFTAIMPIKDFVTLMGTE